MARRYTAIISLLTVGETKILSLTPHGGVTDTTLKPPLKHLQWLGEGSWCIYTSTSGPKEVLNSNPETLILWYSTLSFLSQLSDFTIWDSVASTTLVFLPFSFIHSFLPVFGWSLSTLLLDDHWQFQHHQKSSVVEYELIIVVMSIHFYK